MGCSEIDGLGDAHREAWIELLLAHSKLTRECNRAMEQAGVVSLDIYDVLLSIEMAEPDPMRMSELADAVVISRSGLTRLADRLEADGLVSRVSCPNDRRSVHIVLTEKGRAERERAWPVFREAIVRGFAKKITTDEATAMAQVLRKVRLT